MPHVSSSGGDDLGSTDEVKVFKDEGDGEDEKRSSENLTEEKSSLIDLTESEEKSGSNYTSNKHAVRPDHSPVFAKVEAAPHTSSFNMGYLVSPYSYANGAAGPIPVSMASKMGLGGTAGVPFFCHNGDPLSQPPPAHMGIPPYQLDGKGAGPMGEYGGQPQPPRSISPAEWRRLGPLLAATGLTRPPMYPFSAGQYPYPMLSPEMSQVAATWHTPSMYPLSAGGGFRSPYPSTLPISTASLPGDFYRFSPTSLIPPHPGLSPHPPPHLASHAAIVTPGPKQELPDLNHSSGNTSHPRLRHALNPTLSDTGAVDMEKQDEPLNLTVKKMPIAIVAPFSFVADTQQHHSPNANNNNNNNTTADGGGDEDIKPVINNSRDGAVDLPQDLSLKSVKYGECLDLTNKKTTNKNHSVINNNHNNNNNNNNNSNNNNNNILPLNLNNVKDEFAEQNSNRTTPDESTVRTRFNKNTVNEQEQELKSYIYQHINKLSSAYEQLLGKNFANTNGTNLLDNNLLTSWYVNSWLSRQLQQQQEELQQRQQPASVVETPPPPQPPQRRIPSNNRILNNLLEKPPYNADKFPIPFEALIKNDMGSDVSVESNVKSLFGSQDQKNNIDGKGHDSNNGEKKKPHIKKPLNAFMLYMKEMRAKVVAECTLKESAAINQILGRRWHSLSREEQAKYYEKARQERQLHMQLYPGWSARDNYGYGTKKKKRKKERTPVESGGNSMKKCRARYGLDQQSQWCKPCRRKKKCIRYMEAGEGGDGNQSDDNLGSCGSMGDANTPPEDDTESLSQSMSSPGGLSGLSSLTSPGGVVMPSPSTSVASPSVSVASPYMLQSPLTPHETFDVKLAPPLQPPRNPVGTNPHDINNPLSVNQLTGQCVRSDSADKDAARIISVT